MSAVAERKIQNAAAFGKVGLAIGGESAERQVSLDGGKAVAAAFTRNGIDFSIYDGPVPLLEAIYRGEVDRVFNLIHGPDGEDGSLQGAMQFLNVPVTGADLPSSALTMDKIRSKWVWERNGINTPAFEYFGPDDQAYETALDRFDLPVFVKPAGLGSSIGISKVSAASELNEAVALARRHGDTIIIEQAINGGEYFAGVLGRTTLPLIRIETPHEFYDYEAKYVADDTAYFCPCGLPGDTESRLRELSLKAFDILGTSGWGRVDFLLDEEGTPWFLEVNTTPGMTDHSLVPQAAAQLGIGFDELVWRILETSL